MRLNYLNLFLLFGCLLTVHGRYTYNISYFDVPVDHFSFTDNRTFTLRYLYNETFSSGDQSSPIFFYAGNEGDIELFAQNTGFMFEVAPRFNASIVFAEHRYYGESLPFGNKSFTEPKYSGFLTSQQALADFAKLLVEKLNPNGRPVIAFGGSYGGMLASWFRMKYPHLIRGAIASSAPIFQFVTPCERFYSIISDVFTKGQGNCSKNIRKSWDILRNQSKTSEGRSTLSKKFKLCRPLTKAEDINEITNYLSSVYSNLAMVNYPYSTSFLAPLPPNPVNAFCDRINGSYNEDQLTTALANALQIYSNYTGQIQCLDTTSAFDPSLGDYGWQYQSCTEMYAPMCVKESENNMWVPWEWNAEAFSNDCYQRFKVRPQKQLVVTTYGGENIKYASNIVFLNGLLDPWSGESPLSAPNDKVIIINMPDTAHHLDLRESNPQDPISVKNARQREIQIITEWLAEEF